MRCLLPGSKKHATSPSLLASCYCRYKAQNFNRKRNLISTYFAISCCRGRRNIRQVTAISAIVVVHEFLSLLHWLRENPFLAPNLNSACSTNVLDAVSYLLTSEKGNSCCGSQMLCPSKACFQLEVVAL